MAQVVLSKFGSSFRMCLLFVGVLVAAQGPFGPGGPDGDVEIHIIGPDR